MSCSIENSVKGFMTKFDKAIKGGATTVSISKDRSLITITPNPRSKNVKDLFQAKAMAEKKRVALEDLSQEYFGDKRYFRASHVYTDEMGNVHIKVRPPFNIYRELLVKKEGVDGARAKLRREFHDYIQEMSEAQRRVDESPNLTDEGKKAFKAEIEAHKEEGIHLFNYQDREIDENGPRPSYNKTFAEELEDYDDDDLDFSDPTIDNGVIIDENGMEYSSENQESAKEYAKTLKQYFVSVKHRMLEEKRRVQDDLRNKNITDPNEKAKANSYLRAIEKQLRSIDNNIEEINKMNFYSMISVLHKELNSLENDLAMFNVDYQDVRVMDLGETLIANKTISRIELLTQLIPYLNANSYSSNKNRQLVNNSEFGHFTEALDLSVIFKLGGALNRESSQAEITRIRNKIQGLNDKLGENRDKIVYSLAIEDPIIANNLADGKLLNDELIKIIEDRVLEDIDAIKRAVSTTLTRDSQSEEQLVRGKKAAEEFSEAQLAEEFTGKFQDSFLELEKFLKQSLGLKNRELRKYINNLFLDKGSFNRKIISKFSTLYNKKVAILNDISRNKIGGVNSLVDSSAEYRNYLREINDNHDLIKVHMLPEVKALMDSGGLSGDYSSYFTGTESEMNAYSEDLKKRLGKDYQRHINKVLEQVQNYDSELERMDMAGDDAINKFKIEKSPFIFSTNLDNSIQNLSTPGHSFGETTTEIRIIDDTPVRIAGVTYFNTGHGFVSFIPKGEPDSNKSDFSQQFHENIEKGDQLIYDTWQNAFDLQVNYINKRLNQSTYTSTKVAHSLFSKMSELSSSGNRWAAFRMLFSFKNLYQHYMKGILDRSQKQLNLIGVKSQYGDAATKAIEKRAAMHVNTKSIEELLSLVQDAKIKTKHYDDIISEIELETKNNPISDKTLKTRASKRYKRHLAEAFASEEVLSRFEDDFANNLMATAKLAETQRAQERALSVANMLVYLMGNTSNTFSPTEDGHYAVRTGALKDLKDEVEATIQGNTSETGEEIIGKYASTGDVHRDAKLEKGRYNESKAGRLWKKYQESPNKNVRNAGRGNFRVYEKLEKDHLKFLKSVIDGKIVEDFTFKITNANGYQETFTAMKNSDGVVQYYKKIHDVNKGDQTSVTSEAITLNDYHTAIGQYYVDQTTTLGAKYTIKGHLSGIKSAMGFTMLAFNYMSGIGNGIEGMNSSKLESIFNGEEDNFRYANKFLKGYNKKRLQTRFGKQNTEQFRILNTFFEKNGLYQSRVSAIESGRKKASRKVKSETEITSYESAAYAAAIDFPERKNQYRAALTELYKEKIEMADGTKVRVFGPAVQYEYDDNGKITGIKTQEVSRVVRDEITGIEATVTEKVPIYDNSKSAINIYTLVDGELKLIPGLDTPANKKIWEDFSKGSYMSGQANPVLAAKMRMTKRIIRTQGNFSPQDYNALMNNIIGKTLSMFTVWFGEMVNRSLYSTKKKNLLTGEDPREGYINKSIFRNIGSATSTISPWVLGIGALTGGANLAATASFVMPSILVAYVLNSAAMHIMRNSSNPTAQAHRDFTQNYINRGIVDPFLSSLQQVAVRTMNPWMSMVGLTKVANKLNNKTTKVERLLQDNISEHYDENDINRMKMFSQASAAIINWKLLGFMVTGAIKFGVIQNIIFSTILPPPDEDDTEEEKRAINNRRMWLNEQITNFGNFAENFTHARAASILPFMNPVEALGSKMTENVFISNLNRYIKDVGTVFDEDRLSENYGGNALKAFTAVNTLLGIKVPGKVAANVMYLGSGATKGSLGPLNVKVYEPNTWSNQLSNKLIFHPELKAKALIGSKGKKETIAGEIFEYMKDSGNFNEWYLRENSVAEAIDKDAINKAIANEIINKKTDETQVERVERLMDWVEHDTQMKTKDPKRYKAIKDAYESVQMAIRFKDWLGIDEGKTEDEIKYRDENLPGLYKAKAGKDAAEEAENRILDNL